MLRKLFSNIAVVVQCRLSSTRLPQKAIKDLAGSECLCWTLNAMKKVKAARYFLACDYDSKSRLEPVAQKCGWEIFAGDRDDVLSRFCSLIENEFPECDLIVRATGDNPFLFWEAAELSIKVFQEKYPDADYFTFSGLPHGSGVELFKASSILKARGLTDSAYDKEHVGPALYRHADRFNCVFEKAPDEFYAPSLRTTIDTFADYKRAERLCRFFAQRKILPPFAAKDVILALKNPSLQKTLLFVPSVEAGRGTGHLRRALSLAARLGAFVYVPAAASLKEADSLLREALQNGLDGSQVVTELMGGWDLVVLDLFKSRAGEVENFSALGPVCSIDDGGLCESADYLLDVIPSMPRKRLPCLKANFQSPALIDLPKTRRATFPSSIKTALVCVSGETRTGLSARAVQALESLGVQTTEVSSKKPVRDLRERLASYDLIVTHYGFTAFEAVAANCAALLLATSPLHEKLSKRYGFACLKKSSLTQKKVRALLDFPRRMENKKFKEILRLEKNSPVDKGAAALGRDLFSAENSLASFLLSLSSAQKFSCPICGAAALGAGRRGGDKVAARTRTHTFRRCQKCGMLYLSFSSDSDVQYEADYFGSEYKAQYGRTYLDDFDSIKEQGLRRAKKILSAPAVKRLARPRLLDIGCAYGPFLAAAKDLGFEPYGSDISQSALDYVKNKLGFKSVLSSFAEFDCKKTFGFERFDAVTMWYVIEHCRDLDSLLRRVNALLNVGGVFSFSTPNARGLSGVFDGQGFFEKSPRDHYTLWEFGRAKKILRRYGFKAYKRIPTGLHPERLKPFKNLSQKSFIIRFLSLFCRLFALGDTFEIYCVKVGEAL